MAPQGVDIQGVDGFGLLDTGADKTVLDLHSAVEMGLTPVGVAPYRPYDSSEDHKTTDAFDADLELAEIGSWPLKKVGSFDLRRFNLLAVIGRDILGSCLLIVNGPSQSVRLSLRSS